MNVINKDSLKILNNHLNYKKNPFDHIVIDNFLKQKYIDKLVNYSQKLKLSNCTDKRLPPNEETQYKYAYNDIDNFPDEIKYIFNDLLSKDFCLILENFTNIKNIITDNNKLKGAGIHKITKNGFLNLHTDFNNYNDNKYGSLDRRINIIIYLNPDWKEEYMGHLWLCNKDPKEVKKKILPIVNRCVIFNTTNKSIHGHPQRLKVPDDKMHRNSIALYYYTKNSNTNKCFENDLFHGTIYYKTNTFKRNQKLLNIFE